MSDEIRNDRSDRFPLPIILLLVTALIVIIFSVGNYYHYFGDEGSIGGKTEFGQLGDYIGGLLNPILSFCTVVLLIWSIQVQLKELKATRTELADTKEVHEKQRLQDREYGIRRELTEHAHLQIQLCENLLNEKIGHFDNVRNLSLRDLVVREDESIDALDIGPSGQSSMRPTAHQAQIAKTRYQVLLASSTIEELLPLLGSAALKSSWLNTIVSLLRECATADFISEKIVTTRITKLTESFPNPPAQQ